MRAGRRETWLAAALAALCSGCAAKDYGTSASFDPLARFPASATFNWDERQSRLPDDPRLRELDLASLLRDALGSALAARGYTDARGGPSSYRLAYQLDVKTWMGVDRQSAIGSLSVELSEAASGRRVWSGFARAPIHVGRPEDERRQRLREVLDDMLKEFPPRQR